VAIGFPFQLEVGYHNPMSVARPNTFKLVQINAENLFLFLDDTTPRDWKSMSEKDWQRLSSATVPNKPLVKTIWLAESLLEINADIIAVNEVGGEESLHNFAKLFLKDLYIPYLIEGNSDRGIDVGYLVRRDFPMHVELRTHKNRPIKFLYPHEQESNLYFQGLEPERTHKSHYFSRDCSELRISSASDQRPQLIILLVHLKSKLDPEGIDPGGKQRRQAEVNALVEIYRETRAEFQPPVPVIVTGDFNGCARREKLSEEFAEFGKTDLESVIELAGHRDEQAATQIQFSRGGGLTCIQLDYILISPELHDQLIFEGVEVFRYRSDLKIPLPLPKTLEQRTYLPSDHYPVVATFKNFFSGS
jgi:endonuclease/exonuclease/phosphatase family metal-dependent hydrolase